MTTYNVSTGILGAFEKTASAGTADKVLFTEKVGRVRVVTDGAAGLFIRTDGTDPDTTSPTRGTHYLPPFPGFEDYDLTFDAGTVTDIRLKSTGTPTYSIVRL